MLKGIDPGLNAELLYVLRAMGHGDTLIVADANFPSASIAKQSVHGALLRLDGMSAPEALRSILSLMPLDDFEKGAAGRMEVVGDPAQLPEVQIEALDVIRAANPGEQDMVAIERNAFYAMARQAFAVVQTGEQRLYGCFSLRKGIIRPRG